MQRSAHEIYAFGEFRLDLTRGALYRGNEELKLRPKSFEVLKYLTENQGRLVSKDEIIETVWQATAVTDDSLVQCLKDIRSILGDSAQQIIKTVPRRGYIFEKEVTDNASNTYLAEATSIQVVIEETVDTKWDPEGYLRSLSGTRRQAAVIVAVLSLFGIATAITWYLFSSRSKEPNSVNPPPLSASLFQSIDVKSLTHIGNIVNSAISPDGKWIVYTAGENGKESLSLRQLSTDSTQQIVAPSDEHYLGISFSPDGEYVYFLRTDKTTANSSILFRVPALGGVPEKISVDMQWRPGFSPGGEKMAFVRDSESLDASALIVADADGKNERKLSTRPYNEPYTYPVWSPDGSMIAASAGSVELGDSSRDVVIVDVDSGAERSLTTRRWYWISCLEWLADGSGLILAGNPEKSLLYSQLWLIGYPNGDVRQVSTDSHNYNSVSLTSDTRTLLGGHTELLTHLWLGPSGDGTQPRRVSPGLGDYKHVRWTPDDKMVLSAFGNKNTDLFLRDRDGQEISQLTVNSGTNWGQEVSRDGRYIVFDSDRTGDFHIWRIDADGGNPVQLTKGNGEKFPSVSLDGKWVIYTSFTDWTLWKIAIDGGESIKVAESYARQSSISPDGKWIVYMASERNREIVIPFEGGPPLTTIELPPGAPLLQPVRWSPDSKAIQFIVRRNGVDDIWQQSLKGGQPRQITNFSSDQIFSYDWSNDGKTLAVVRGAWTTNLALITQKPLAEQ